MILVLLIVLLHSRFHGDDRSTRYAIAWLVGDRRAVADGRRRRCGGSTSAWRSARLARPARPPGVHADAAGDDRPRDRQPRQLINSVLRSARLEPGAARDRPRVPDLHAARRGSSASRSRPCCSRRSAGMAARRDAGRDAPHGRQRDAPDQPAADPVRGAACSCSRRRSRGWSTSAATFDAHSTHLVSMALFWFAFSLPFGGLNLLLTRTFFALQRPWIPTKLAAINMVVDVDRQPRAVQAAGHRRPGDRHRGRQRGDDRAAAAPPADRASTAASRAARR